MRRDLVLAMATVLAVPGSAFGQAGCAEDNAGLKLAPGFCASIYADSIAGVRQIAVASNGDVLIETTQVAFAFGLPQSPVN